MFDKVEETERTERLVWKRKVDDLQAIDRNESWFSDMAEQGLFLESIGRYFVKFRKGPPRHARYRIDVLPRELTEDELTLYDSCGWHYATKDMSVTGLFSPPLYLYVFETEECAALPELHTDPMEQAESLRRLNRQSVDGIWSMLIMTALFAGLSLWPFFQNSHFERFNWLMGGNSIFPSIFPLLLLWILYIAWVIRQWRTTRRLWQRLKNGKALDHRADYRVSRRRYLLLSNGLLVLAIAMSASFFLRDYDGTKSLPEGPTDFPAVRLTEFRGTVSEDEISGNSTHEWTNAGAVVDEICEYTQQGKSARIQLSTTCYRLPFAWISHLAFHVLLDDDCYQGISEIYDVGEITPVQTQLVDEAWAAAPNEKNGEQFVLFVRDGRYIVQILYSDDFSGDPGAPEMYRDRCTEKILPLLAQRLDADG